MRSTALEIALTDEATQFLLLSLLMTKEPPARRLPLILSHLLDPGSSISRNHFWDFVNEGGHNRGEAGRGPLKADLAQLAE